MRTTFKIIATLLSLIVVAVVVIMLVVEHKELKFVENTSEKIFQPEVTTMNFPLLISMKDIEQVANAKIKHVLADKRIPLNNGNDTLILKVTRMGKLDFSLDNAYFNSSIPLKLEVQYIKKIIGKKNVQFFKKEPLTLFISAKFRSIINIRENMKLNVRSTLTEIQWNEEPNIKVLGIEFNLKEKINEIMLEKAPGITSRIDQLISAKIDLKKPALKVWNNIQKSIKANKKQKDLYVRIQPQTLGIHVDKTLNDSLKLDLIVTSKVFVRFAEDTAGIALVAFPKKIDVIARSEVEGVSKIYLHCLFPLERLNRILKKELAGKEFQIKGYNVKIRRIRLINGQHNIYLRVKHSGSIKGEILLRGFPRLSEDKKVLAIKNVSFENRLDDEVFNSMADLLHQQILELMRDYMSFDVGGLMDAIPDYARKAISKSKISKKADISLVHLDVDDLHTMLTKDNIQFLISGKSSFEVSLKKESFKILKKKK